MNAHSIARICLLFVLTLTGADAARAQSDSILLPTGTHKVGDRIMADPTLIQNWDSCTITSIERAPWKPGFDADYHIRCDHNPWSSVAAASDRVKAVTEDAAPVPGPASPREPAGVRPHGLPIVTPMTPQPALTAPANATGGNRFGTREPRTCPQVTGGTPSPSAAAALVACSREQQSREHLEYIISDVHVASMTPSRYDPHTQTGFTNLDVNVSPLRITGSLQSWQCNEQSAPTTPAKYSNVGQNCRHENEHVATGYCWKQRTGLWACTMADVTSAVPDVQDRVPPPR